jgi:uncharacterized RDD family membrane protein YckC/cytoskeletal protein CcmA (bactofilin family)
MKRHYLLRCLSTVAALALTLAPITRGEDSPPPAPAATDKPAPPPAAEPAKPETPPAPVAAEAPAAPSVAPAPAPQAAEPAKEPEAAEQPSTELRRLDTEVKPTPGDIHQEVRQAIKKAMHKHAAASHTGNERVAIGHDTHIGKDEKADAAVSILGSTTVDGEVSDAAVSVLGSTTVNGSVGDAAVAVMGSVHVTGHVGGDVVAVGGNIELGPNAEVGGQVVVVGGTLQKDPAAVVHGQIQQVSIAQHFPKFDWLFAWVKSALFKGRLLSFESGTGWAWMVAGAFLGFYLLCALIFPRGIEKCAETLEQRPGFTILTALLTMLAMPLVFLLLAITGIGILVIPFLATGLFVAKLFGRATMLAWFGRRFTGWLGGGLFSHAVMNVLIGGILVALLYTVPILAFIVSMLIGILGLGTVIYALILSMRRNGAKPAPAAAAVAPIAGPPPPVAGVAFAAGGAGESVAGAAVPPFVPVAAPPAIVSAVTLPRAGFWIRTGALAIDLILCAVIIKVLPWVHFRSSLVLLVLAAYGAVMWKLRGTTVGGSICHLKVVRLDDRPLDWTAAIVRALSCFLSLFVVGLGFLWVAFDNEKQSWHDKIAGTAVVRVPKSVSLI